jgi:nitrate/nitrite transporter NarK
VNPDSLQTSFWVMILIQTIGAVDLPGKGERKMPAPREYVAIVVAWLILQLVSGIGQQAQRATAALGWLLVVAGMVLGPFGGRLVGFMKTVASNFPVVNSGMATATTTTTPTIGSTP